MKKNIKPKSPTVPFSEGRIITEEEVNELLPVRSNKYGAAIEYLTAMEAGESVRFPMPKGTDVRRAIRGLVSAMNARGIKAPAGYGYYKQIGTDGSLIVTMKARKARSN